MKNIFCNLTLADTVRLCLFNNKGRIYFIERSYLSKKLLSNDFLKKKGLEIFDWNYNDLREDGMLLGYKVEIEYLNNFINYLTDNYKGNLEHDYVKLNFKKELLNFKIHNEIGLYEILLIFFIINNRYPNSHIFIPKNKYSQLISKYLKFNFSNIVSTDINKFRYFIKLLLKNLKFKIKTFLILFKSVKYSNNDIIGLSNKISLEVALNVFNPIYIFNNIERKNLLLINKIHRLSKKDQINLEDSKKNFIPLYIPKNKILNVDTFQNKKQNELIGRGGLNKDFYNEYKHWYKYFNSSNTKIYVTSYKYNSHIVPASFAINVLNGVSCLFQTSFYEKTTPYTAFYSDIYFSFSNKFNTAEKLIGSKFKYNISVGYIYDYKFENSKKKSSELRNRIQQNGARKIISFFDQGATQNTKFTPGYFQTRESYKFILEKFLNNEWLGLIIKPKKPSLLKNSLGPVYDLLTKAMQSNRCHVYLNSDEILNKNFDNPPCEAAMASDLAIHNCLVAGTAGIEAALTNTDTLYFDYYGFKESIFYNSKNKIVFNNWDKLWDHVINVFNNKNKNHFNRWNFLLNQIDPFNDGKAMERIENFSKNLLNLYSNFNDKNSIIENTVKKYKYEWGSDKILTNF